MPRRRFLVPTDRIRDRTAILPPDQAHHLLHVLRIRDGQEIEVFDGEGNAYTGIVEVEGEQVRATLLAPVPSRDAAVKRSVVLGAALIRGEKFEWIIQKATELGVEAFVPLETRRCAVNIPDVRRASRMARWRAIAEEAARQCRRDSVPAIHEICTFPDFVGNNRFPGFARYLCYEESVRQWNQELLRPRKAILCIGPEGGWERAEVVMAAAAGFQDFTLGSRILRSETAALAALALFQLEVSASGLHIV